jgi:hypothetical protein
VEPELGLTSIQDHQIAELAAQAISAIAMGLSP